jgi:hypothetical protein
MKGKEKEQKVFNLFKFLILKIIFSPSKKLQGVQVLAALTPKTFSSQ